MQTKSKKVMNSLIEQLSNSLVTVKNVVDTTNNDSQNLIEWYFDNHPWSSMECPCCGKIMYRKKFFNQKHPIMVGAHVEILDIDLFKGQKYIIPLCEECNNKKDNLQPFKIKAGYLKIAPHST